jgi:hypothetical protein
VPSGLMAYADVAKRACYSRHGISYRDLCDPDLLRPPPPPPHTSSNGSRAAGNSSEPKRRRVGEPDPRASSSDVTDTAKSASASGDAAGAAASVYADGPASQLGGSTAPRQAKDLEDVPTVVDDVANAGVSPLDESAESRRGLFYGFWGACYNAYEDAHPHDGYSSVLRWRDRVGPNRFFCLTTNVDGHWHRFLPPDSVEEFNGSTRWWRCANMRCVRELAEILPPTKRDDGEWEPVRAREPLCPDGLWEVPRGIRFAVDPSTGLAPVDHPAGGALAALCVGTAQPHDAAAFAFNHPRCVRCCGFARPNVKMFGDSDTYGRFRPCLKATMRL